MDPSSSQTMARLIEWMEEGGSGGVSEPYGHLCISRQYDLVSRATMLINQAMFSGKHVIYVVWGEVERDFLLYELRWTLLTVIPAAWSESRERDPVVIATQKEFYAFCKHIDRHGFRDKNTVIIKEVDIYWSLEHALGMCCLLNNDIREGSFVLTVSHQPVDGTLMQAILSLANMHFCDFRLFGGLDQITISSVNFEHGGNAMGQVLQTLKAGKKVLFADKLLAENIAMLIKKEGIQANVIYSDTTVATWTKFIQKPSRVPTVDDASDEFMLPTVMIYDTEDKFRIPMPIQDLGMIFMAPNHVYPMFDADSGHTVYKSVDLSRAEIEDIVSYLRLSSLPMEDVVIRIRSPLREHLEPMPPRRIQHGQREAFLFELLQVCLNVRFRTFAEIMIPDWHVPASLMPVFLRKELVVKRRKDKRRYTVPEYGKTERIKKILPAVDFDLSMALFLAHYSYNQDKELVSTKVLRSIFRMGAIFHYSAAEVVEPVVEELAAKQGLYPCDLWNLGDKAFKQHLHIPFPEILLSHGTIWAAFAVYRRFEAKHGSGVADEDAAPNRREKLMCKIHNLMLRIEKTYGYEPMQGHIELDDDDAHAIQLGFIDSWSGQLLMFLRPRPDLHRPSYTPIDGTHEGIYEVQLGPREFLIPNIVPAGQKSYYAIAHDMHFERPQMPLVVEGLVVIEWEAFLLWLDMGETLAKNYTKYPVDEKLHAELDVEDFLDW